MGGITIPNTEIFWKVGAIDKFGKVSVIEFDQPENIYLPINECAEIPLDESWLIRCKQFTRWDYFGDENYGGYFNLWGPWKLMVRHFKSGFVVSIVTIDRKRMCYRLVKEIDLKVSYVHQLQNFIWSARQEELQFAEE